MHTRTGLCALALAGTLATAARPADAGTFGEDAVAWVTSCIKAMGGGVSDLVVTLVDTSTKNLADGAVGCTNQIMNSKSAVIVALGCSGAAILWGASYCYKVKRSYDLKTAKIQVKYALKDKKVDTQIEVAQVPAVDESSFVPVTSCNNSSN